MSPFDVLLPEPLPELWVRLLLFLTFAVHLLFVLLTIGTAIIGVTEMVRRSGAGRRLLRSFFVVKSIAIVFGVAPILLLQVGHPVAFLTAARLLAPLWMAIAALLIAALALVELAAHGSNPPARRDWLVGSLGVGCLLAVPAIFAAVVVTAENPSAWSEIFARGGRFPPALAVHWFLRLLHVIGAAVVVTAAYRLLRVGDDPEARRADRAWLLGALLFQIAVGVVLYGRLGGPGGAALDAAVGLGAVAAVVLLAVLGWYRRRPPSWALLAGTVAVLLSSMLVARQLHQDRALLGIRRQAAAAAVAHQKRVLAVDTGPAFFGEPVPVGDAATVFLRSCSPCHGVVGTGAGDDAPLLTVAPEDLSGLRLRPEDLHRILRQGVDATGMPRFGFYTRWELDRLARFLAGEVGLVAHLEAPALSPAENREALELWNGACATCHRPDGSPSGLGRTLDPSPPDLARLGLAPWRAYEVVSDGYPGTLMPAFRHLPEGSRRLLVARLGALYAGSDR